MSGVPVNYDDELRVRSHVADFDSYVERYRIRSAETRRLVTYQPDVVYGPSGSERFDVFLPIGESIDRPLHVFFHGGYWRAFDKSDYSYVAGPLVAAGVVAIIANYGLMPMVSMAQLLGQCRALIQWLYENAPHFGASSRRLSISGHSAGAHIASILHLTDWDEWGLPKDLIQSTLALSGLYDLNPVLNSFLRQETGLSDEDVRQFSPMSWIEHSGSCARPISLVYGSDETVEMRRQSTVFCALLRKRGSSVALREIAGRHHMSVVLDLGDASSEVGRLLLGQALTAGLG